MKILRIIGREGRITIPYAIRKAAGFRPDDVVSFQLTEDGGVLVRKESFPNLERNLPASDPGIYQAHVFYPDPPVPVFPRLH